MGGWKVFASVVLLFYPCTALHCISCHNCHEQLGTIAQCSNTSDPVCMKITYPSGDSRMCGDKDHCGLGAFERLVNNLLNVIYQVFSDTDRRPIVYCCVTNYCNSAVNGLPPPILHAVSLCILFLIWQT